MATESSAIVRFIELQQQAIVETPPPVRERTDPFTPVEPPAAVRSPRPLLLVGGIVLLAGAAAGLYMARDTLFGKGPSGVQSGIASVGERDDSEPAAPARAVAGDPAEAAAPAVAGNAGDAAEKAVAVDPLPSGPAVQPLEHEVASEPAPQASADTGFDLRVTPRGAKVYLDGKPVGVAPLRVRNVTSGPHAIDIEAPEGYFSRRLDVELALDTPQDLRIELSPVAESSEPAAPQIAPDRLPSESVASVARTEPAERTLSRRERRNAAREAKQAEREAKRAAAREAKLEREAARAAARRAESLNAAQAREEAAALKELKRGAAADSPASAEAGQGTLRLGAKPPCHIFIDGKDTGLTTPQAALPLSAGKHKVRLVNPEFGIDKVLRVRVAADRTTTVIKDLSNEM